MKAPLTEPPAEPLVRFIDVRKSYDGRADAVRALNLDVANGEFLTLLGPSGSGKTTTLTMLAGFEQPTEGRIFVGPEDITNVAVEKRGIGMVFQNYALFPNMTVGENIGFPLKVRRLPRPEIAKHSPTHPDNIKTGVQINAKYWLENQAAVTERFNSWVLK